MKTVAIYARYSCDKQNETSLEDQIRRCRELAARHGFVVNDELIYTDAAVSGTDKGDAHRLGYLRMRKDLDSSKFDILIVDEFSRLSRDAVEQAVLLKRFENNRRVQLITADGINTQDPDWQLRLGLQGLLAQHESRKLSYRVDRGMVGQLDRGYMIAAPAFGYDLKREFDGRDQHIGSHWVINPEKSAIVQEVFKRRAQGDSMHQIANWLNLTGVVCTAKPRVENGGYWRASRINAMLKNPIYRGLFVLRSSTCYAAKMKKMGSPVVTVDYERPTLRLVSDETWFQCNQKTISHSGYGGGKHALSGLVSCGCCNAILSLSAKKQSRSLYCTSCSEAKSAKNDNSRQTSSVATVGVQHLLSNALQYFVSEPFLEAFRQSLQLRLDGDHRAEIDACSAQLEKYQATQSRISRMLANLAEDDDVLEQRYAEARLGVANTKRQLAQLTQKSLQANEQTVQAQMQVDPRKLLSSIFDEDVPPQQLRSVMTRLFPSIVFFGKLNRCTSKFRVRFAAGVAVALASNTETISQNELEACFTLQYRQKTLKTPAMWVVELVDAWE